MSFSTEELTLDANEPWNVDYLAPHASSFNTAGEASADIAPWVDQDEPPTPPPKHINQRSWTIAPKRSIPSFSISRQQYTNSVRSRGSDSHSLAETLSSERTSHSENRSSKSSMGFLHKIKRKASGKIGREHFNASTVIISAPPLPIHSPSSSFLPIPPSPQPPLLTKTPKRRRKGSGAPPPLPPKEPEFKLDTNLEEMDGIVDLNVLAPEATRGDSSSPGSGFESSLSTSDGGGLQAIASSNLPRMYDTPASNTLFRNPFSPNGHISSGPAHGRKRVPPNLDLRKVSPKSNVSAVHQVVPAITQPPTDAEPHSPGWIPPQSWHVDNIDKIPDVPDYTSSEEDSLAPPKTKRRPRNTRPGRTHSLTTYNIRIYRLDGTYHVVRCPLTSTVADMIPVMNRKVLEPKQETHSLYVKERERERVLAPTERPADLVRRRLEQAGYDVADGLHNLGSEEIGFLIKFIYKSNLLGGAGERDITVDNHEYIDLTGRGLKTIPVILHTHADTIVSLNLSRNPMLEIPLDFVQSCTTLRELRLSNMAMKKVPQSVRHSHTLQRLDISCNRIADLDDAELDRIPYLHQLKAQNNRMDKLPWYFPHLRALKFLNISNNKFQSLPAVVSEITSLVDLDISFNNISALPEEIGQLRNLERLVIVGNQITRLPDECVGLVHLATLDCRRNNISDLSLVCKLPRLNVLLVDHNAVHALDLAVGPKVERLDASFNDITQLTIAYGPRGPHSFRLHSLNISHAKLSSFDNVVLSHLTTLTELRLDHNSFRSIPDSLGTLTDLIHLSCSDNKLDALPESIGRLQKLETLDVHYNDLTELPASLWQCASLHTLNVTSNLLGSWHDPPTPTTQPEYSSLPDGLLMNGKGTERKGSFTPSIASQPGARPLPPLARSLRKLYVGENRLTDYVVHPMTILKELQVLNLSFNDIQELPSSFFRNLTNLEEVYLSGNKLSSIPTEDLHRLAKLTVLYLNGNKLQVLPHELGKLTSLTILDVGSNLLKYNINNYEFDWNWNFNQNLKYLNLSGNKRLTIQPDYTQRISMAQQYQHQRKSLSHFANLGQLRVLGLMDVTTTAASSIPEDTEDRRVRTSLSEVNQMAYGIADTLNTQNHILSMVDLVVPEFRGRRDECIFAMFGRSHANAANNKVSKYLSENFPKTFSAALDKLDKTGKETIGDALRRAFLTLNKTMHAFLMASVNYSRKMSTASTATATTLMQADLSVLRSGASGIVAYFVGKTLYIANAGNALAVISRQGTAHLVSKKHEPFDRAETARIRTAEGWVSPKGQVNEDSDVSRSFGFYHLLPAVNPRPDTCVWELSEMDEFLIIANQGLWDFVSYQNAVDIARFENDPMIASQKLRDFAISYGANGSSMIMVVRVSDLFREKLQPTTGLPPDIETFPIRKPNKKQLDISDHQLIRLPPEVPAPTGRLTLVFTDIRNSTHLWEANPGMQTAMGLHNHLLRRQLRLCGGYEVKTEGDAFMCSFHTVLAALHWCLTVQVHLLHESWPLEILECEDGKPIWDSKGKLIARGLSVRMGIHSGTPVCETDPITHRMDYFGPMVNRTARICNSAAGGQIMCSADVEREIRSKVFAENADPETNTGQFATIDTIRRIAIELIAVGEMKMKGVEVPEVLTMIYGKDLMGRMELKDSAAEPDASGSKVQFSVCQMRHLASLCVRLEVLTSSRVFRPLPERKNSVQSAGEERPPEDSVVMYASPDILIPNISDKASDQELMALLDSLSLRIENALASLTLRRLGGIQKTLVTSMERDEQPDQSTLNELLRVLQSVLVLQ